MSKIITLKQSELGQLLVGVEPFPEKLFAVGNLDLLSKNRKRLAVVGSRKVDAYGRLVTHDLTIAAARSGAVIVSGLALGVDALAHQAALEASSGTVAIMPAGLDKIYPTSHTSLARRILDSGGLLLSEYPEGSPPVKVNFIARNRLVSGFSDAVMITQAAEKSGTLHTAKFALEQGKTVLAVPGNIHNPLSAGTNNLIKSGAVAVTSGDDVLLVLGLNPESVKQTVLFGGTHEETIILQLLQTGVTDSSILLEQSGLTADLFGQSLTMLEISGRIRPIGSGHWKLA